jgi:colicin import membrane protein
MKNLNEQLKDSIGIKSRINESVILASIVCASCVAYAAGPLLNTEFMKSIGQGLGNVLGGLGALFSGIGTKGSAPEDELKNIHTLLKKKPDDLTPKEKKQLEEAAAKYDLSEELSENELSKLEKMGIGVSSTDDDDEEDDEKTPNTETKTTNTTIDENVTSASLLAIAAKANEKEKDPEKKAKMDSMIDIMTASTYDENGNLLSMEDRRKKMKELVGEDNWTEFEKDLNDMQKNVKEGELKTAIEETKNNLTEDDIKSLIENQKSRAKSAGDRIKTENDELKALKDELTTLKQDPEGNKDKIKEKEDAIEDKIKKSTLGKASPSAAKASIDKVGKEEGEGKTEPKPEDKTGDDGKGKKETETEKEETEEGKYIVKDEEVTDPETGEKKKVKTYTGPRGGKFYYAEGKPRKPEYKIYLPKGKAKPKSGSSNESINNYSSLKNFLRESIE